MEEELDDYNILKIQVDDALSSLELITNRYGIVFLYTSPDDILIEGKDDILKLGGILNNTNNGDIVSYLFSQYNKFLNKYIIKNSIITDYYIESFDIFSFFVKNERIKYLNTINHIDMYLKIIYLPISFWSLRIPSLIKIIYNILNILNPSINYKILTLIFKNYGNILSNNIEDKGKILKIDIETKKECSCLQIDYYSINKVVYVSKYDTFYGLKIEDEFFDIGQKTVINDFILWLLYHDNGDKFKCLRILLNLDPNLHIIYFCKIMCMDSIESPLLLELLFLYEISEILYLQLKLFYSIRDKYYIKNNELKFINECLLSNNEIDFIRRVTYSNNDMLSLKFDILGSFLYGDVLMK